MSDGRFQPGRSGNPSGRPAGTDRAAKLRAQIEDDVPEIITKLVELAKGGDVGASRLLLERAIPPRKAIEDPVAIDLPEGSLTEQGRAVLAAVADGELAPGQGVALLASLGSLSKLIETDDLERRIKALEALNSPIDSMP